MNAAKRRWIGTLTFLALLTYSAFFSSCSGKGSASVRYKFASPSFSSGQLETLQTAVHTRIKTLYEKRDGKSAGCDWILLKKGDPDETKNRIYFSEIKKDESYVLGISGKQSFLEFASELEAETKKLFPDREYEVNKTSKFKKSVQFLKSEL